MITLTLKYKAGGVTGMGYTDREEQRAIDDARRYFEGLELMESAEVTDEDGVQLFFINHNVERRVSRSG